MLKAKLPFKKFQWTPNLAYVAGLMVTDGNLSKDGRHITMRSSDKDLLYTFRNCLGIRNKIAQSHNNGYAVKPSYRVQFGNVRLYRWFLSVGIEPAKTHTIGTIKIPNLYFRDFLRGHLDGDGTIFFYRDSYNVYKGKKYINTRIYTKFISASEKHISWLFKMIRRNAPVRGALLYREAKDSHVGMWEIKFAKYESLKLFQWLYYQKGIPSLRRKRKKAEDLLKQVNNGRLIR